MKIVLIGNQNSGKTALFNILTNSNRKTGNWPGVTIEYCEGKINKNNDFTIIDLPGTYSLIPYTNEEKITHNFIINENIDLIINVIDATSIERSLYLTTQLLELNLDVLIVLNMYDLVSEKKIEININALEKELNATIIPISSKTNFNILKLKKIILNNEYKKNKNEKLTFYPNDVEKIINKIINLKSFKNHERFYAINYFENEINDSNILLQCQNIEQKYKSDREQLIASWRYDYIVKIKNRFIKAKNTINITSQKIDNIVLHKYFAIPIFILIISVIYYLSIFIIGINIGKIFDYFFNKILNDKITIFLKNQNASLWAISLIVDGIIKGIKLVIEFMPQLIALFFCFSVLETIGYMSRISFFFDRLFHKFGLSGKSIIPFIIGTGCSVPGITNTRTIENEKERIITMVLVPFIPCNTKLIVISFFLTNIMNFLKKEILFSMLYIESILIIILVLFLFQKFQKIIFKNENNYSSYISEMPEYKKPNIKYILSDVRSKLISFIKHTGLIIILCSIIIWFLTSFTFKLEYIGNQNHLIEKTILAKIGNFFAWFFYLILGGKWSWAASISAIQGLISKEQIISSMNIIGKDFFTFFTPITAFAFLTFNLFSIPCVGTLSAMYNELKSIKKLLFIIFFEITLVWIISSFIGILNFFIK